MAGVVGALLVGAERAHAHGLVQRANLPIPAWTSSPLNINSAEQLRKALEEHGLVPASDIEPEHDLVPKGDAD